MATRPTTGVVNIPRADLRKGINDAADAVDEWLSDLMDALKKDVEEYAEKVWDEMLRTVAVDTGNLRSTLEVVLNEIAGKASFEALVGTKKTTYAAFVEFGTSKMEAQPYIRPALKKYMTPFIKAVRRTVKRFRDKASTYDKNPTPPAT